MILSRKIGRKRIYAIILEGVETWMTAETLCTLKGCDLERSTLVGRINNRSHNPVFETIEGCLYTPKKKIDCEGILELGAGRKSFMASRDLLDQIEFDKLMPVGSMSHEVR